MVEQADGHRLLIAPTDEIADVRVGGLRVRRDASSPRSTTERTAGALRFTRRSAGRRRRRSAGATRSAGPCGACRRRSPRAPRWATVVDPIARLTMRGVRTRGDHRRRARVLRRHRPPPRRGRQRDVGRRRPRTAGRRRPAGPLRLQLGPPAPVDRRRHHHRPPPLTARPSPARRRSATAAAPTAAAGRLAGLRARSACLAMLRCIPPNTKPWNGSTDVPVGAAPQAPRGEHGPLVEHRAVRRRPARCRGPARPGPAPSSRPATGAARRRRSPRPARSRRRRRSAGRTGCAVPGAARARPTSGR